VRPKVDQRAGLLSLPHLGIFAIHTRIDCERYVYAGNIYLSHWGVLTPWNFFWHPQHCPVLEVLRVLTRTLIGSILFSAIGGYCSNLHYYIVVCIRKHSSFVLNIRLPFPLGICSTAKHKCVIRNILCHHCRIFCITISLLLIYLQTTKTYSVSICIISNRDNTLHMVLL